MDKIRSTVNKLENNLAPNEVRYVIARYTSFLHHLLLNIHHFGTEVVLLYRDSAKGNCEEVAKHVLLIVLAGIIRAPFAAVFHAQLQTQAS